MEKGKKELRLGSLIKQDVIYCHDCAILILRHIRRPERWPPLIGRKYLSCPLCGELLVSVEEEEGIWLGRSQWHWPVLMGVMI